MEGEGGQLSREAPRGIYPARIDDKGRLKLPAAFQQYMQSWGTKVFVTSLDLRTVRIYPIALWKQNEILFDGFKVSPQAAAQLWFVANDLGADAELDGQGRIMIHPDLRRQLGIENQPVHLVCYQGRVDVLSQAQYEARKQAAVANLQANLQLLEENGLR